LSWLVAVVALVLAEAVVVLVDIVHSHRNL